MDGVFMGKCCKNLVVCLLLVCFVWMGTVLADRQKLREELIRIHVVAASDSPRDQQRKLQVRDAVMESIQNDLKNISDAESARTYLREKLPYIQSVAGQTLEALGCREPVTVSFGKERFERKKGPVVALPAGVYECLRIVIGPGQGTNWWSVLFSETVYAEEPEKHAVSVFSSPILPEETEIRFYCLDMLGRLENIFFRG